MQVHLIYYTSGGTKIKVIFEGQILRSSFSENGRFGGS